VTIKSGTHAEQEAFQNTESFKQLAANRYKIEAKNSELKNGQGYDTTSAASLFGMGFDSGLGIKHIVCRIFNEK